MPRNRSQWQRTIKRRCKANDLNALRMYFAIKVNDKWNNDVKEVHA